MRSRPLRLLGIPVLLATLGGCVGCSTGADEEAPGLSGAYGDSTSESLGSFRFTVEPLAAEPVKVQLIDRTQPENNLLHTNDLGAGNTVLSSVSLAGKGVWSDANQTLTAPVVITHLGTSAGDLDEVQLVITSLTDTTGTVTFETSNNGNLGVGAVVAFADAQHPSSAAKCGSTVRTSAGRSFVIKDTVPSTSFSFTADVRALRNQPVAAIQPDCDSDGFNIELAQDAGDDCNDGLASVQTGCTCAVGGCTTPGSSCSESGGGNVLCDSDCICEIDGSELPDTNAVCTSDCSVTCDNPQDGGDGRTIACGVVCSGADTDCDVSCTNATSGSCVTTCRDGSTCDVTCDTNAESCLIVGCSEGSDCSTDCIGSNDLCGITGCRETSTCEVTCGPGDYSWCGIGACATGSSCTVNCAAGTGDTCELTCGPQATDCTIDCQDVPAAQRDATCQLTCTGNRNKTGVTEGGRFKYKCL